MSIDAALNDVDALAGMVNGEWLDEQTFPALQWAVRRALQVHHTELTDQPVSL